MRYTYQCLFSTQGLGGYLEHPMSLLINRYCPGFPECAKFAYSGGNTSFLVNSAPEVVFQLNSFTRSAIAMPRTQQSASLPHITSNLLSLEFLVMNSHELPPHPIYVWEATLLMVTTMYVRSASTSFLGYQPRENEMHVSKGAFNFIPVRNRVQSQGVTSGA
jgi:hypothetical protein